MKTQHRSIIKKIVTCCLVLVLDMQSFSAPPQVTLPTPNAALSSMATLPGQSATILSNGSILLLGGIGKKGVTATAAIGDSRTGLVTTLSQSLNLARAWHTASVLPNGTVLVVGGEDSKGQVINESEIFDPSSMTFRIVVTGLAARAHHAATLLTDGRLLLAGGVGADGSPLTGVEFWDSRLAKATAIENALSLGRRDDHSALLADGTALFWGGTDAQGNKLGYAEVYDPILNHFTGTGTTQAAAPDFNLPFLEDSIPQDGATAVATGALIGVRFSKVLQSSTISPTTVNLQLATGGNVAASVVAAEGGRLAFVNPASPLLPGTQYALTLQGATDTQNLAISYKVVIFTTAGTAPVPAANPQKASSSNPRPQTPSSAPPGVTAISGQTLRLDGTPLPNVMIKVGSRSARSDIQGHFLLTNPPTGFQALLIDGRTATIPHHAYGVFEAGVDVQQGRTLRLPYVIWMTELDMAHAVHVQFPTKGEVVITTPTLPGLEFHIPPNTTITDIDGKAANLISITPVPITRPPFPLPHIEVPIYFTIQPGGGKIWVNNLNGPDGGRLFYPNLRNQPPGSVVDFWNYDPHTARGWYIYGRGTVSADGKTIVPNPGVVVYELTGAMVGGSNWGTHNGPGCTSGCSLDMLSCCADPVDPSTGLFMYQKTDLYLPDTIPISVTRVYRQNDPMMRAFGVGMSIPYDMWIEGTLNDFSYVELVQADGSRLQFTRTAGSGYLGSTLQCISCPGPFFGAIFYDPTPGLSVPSLWDVLLRDGTLLSFLQPGNWSQPDYQGSGLVSITDRNGNQIQITRSGAGTSSGTNYITEVRSPNGRWIQFSYGNSSCPSCITSATDNSGRIVRYYYTAANQLNQITDANLGTWSFGWSPTKIDQMTSLTDARNIQFLNNYYDSNDRISYQTQFDGTQYLFSYVTDASNNITQTTITDPNQNLRVIDFGTPEVFADGYYTAGGMPTTDTQALGKPEQQVTSYQNDPSTGLLTNVTDSLNRQTSYTYDSLGNTLSVTKLAGTPNAVTNLYTYDPIFSQVTSITDPLQNKTTFGYDSKGNIISSTDPLGNTSNYTHDSTGRLTTLADPLGNTWRLAYTGADLTSTTDPLGNVVQAITDAAGRVVAAVNPLGQATKYQYNPLNRLTQKTDPAGSTTLFTYDPNSRLSSVTDPRNTQNPTQFVYNSMDRLSMRTDPLGAFETVSYDANGNASCYVDRRGLATVFSYDGINRPISAGYGATNCSSTSFQNSIAYTYDGGNRLIGIQDSNYGTIAPIFDGLDRIISEVNPKGSISYQYDMDSRETQMTVAGQPSVNYVYDNDNRLTGLSKSSSNMAFGYDIASRLTSLSLPNSVTLNYGYDIDSRLNSIMYSSLSAPLGNLTYGYDQDSRITQVGGSFARTGLPTALSSATYDAANRLTSWGSNSAFSYDANGNLVGDGTNAYVWDARNQLSSISGAVTASFQYDPTGRRISKTIGGVATGFLYDGWNVVQELSGATPTATVLSGGIDEIFNRTDTVARGFLPDGMGSTAALTDATGTVTTQYSYEPFGNTSTSGSSSNNSFQYTGRENDGTGLYFYRQRYYNPVAQRFIGQDPIGFRGGDLNLYAYAFNSPTNVSDPLGEFLSYVHRAITEDALVAAGLPPDPVFEDLVAGVDRGTQGPNAYDTNIHAMGGMIPGRKGEGEGGHRQTCQEAYQGTAASLAQDYQSGNLTQALHTIQDAFAPGHEFQFWDGGYTFAHIPGWSHILGDAAPPAAAVLGATQASTTFLKDYLNHPYETQSAPFDPSKYLPPNPCGG